ncbi:unnamed protein product [Chironomus riparius]|uniref:Uncharacterized protein n=1 Tax=Chironomus riparius TaxID=315576 RepID=A0A9N9RMT2_9DIPT|nr:unnamed protein product [Chironomus riparius]
MDDFKTIVKKIYESDESNHTIDFNYSRFFTNLMIQKCRNNNPQNKIMTRLLTIERNGQLLPKLTCYLTPTNIMVADCAINEGHSKGMFKHLKPESALQNLNVELIPAPIQYLPDAALLMTAVTKFTHEKVPYSIKNDPGLAIALALIESIFEGFWTKYELYLQNPDEEMRVIDDNCNFNAKWGKIYFCGFIAKKRTEAEKKFIAFMIILSIFKPLNDIQSAVNARKKRYLVIKSMYDSLPANQDAQYVDTLTMQHLAKYFSKLPRLKSMILSCAVLTVRELDNQPIHDYLLKILIPLEMILFIIIDEFVCMPEKTKAHCHKKIIKEIHYFLTVKQKLKERFGDNYYFAKLLDPTIKEVNVGNWKHLGALALMSANVKYPKTEQLKVLGLLYEIDYPELLMNVINPNSVGRADSGLRDSDLFLKAMYGN